MLLDFEQFYCDLLVNSFQRNKYKSSYKDSRVILSKAKLVMSDQDSSFQLPVVTSSDSDSDQDTSSVIQEIEHEGNKDALIHNLDIYKENTNSNFSIFAHNSNSEPLKRSLNNSNQRFNLFRSMNSMTPKILIHRNSEALNARISNSDKLKSLPTKPDYLGTEPLDYNIPSTLKSMTLPNANQQSTPLGKFPYIQPVRKSIESFSSDNGYDEEDNESRISKINLNLSPRNKNERSKKTVGVSFVNKSKSRDEIEIVDQSSKNEPKFKSLDQDQHEIKKLYIENPKKMGERKSQTYNENTKPAFKDIRLGNISKTVAVQSSVSEQAFHRILDVVQDKSCYSKKTLRPGVIRQSKREQGSMLASLLKKHAENGKGSIDKDGFVKLVDQLKKSKIGPFRRLRIHLKGLANSFSQSLRRKIILFRRSPKIIEPDHKGRLLWDLIITVFVMLDLIMIPLRISFDEALDANANVFIYIEAVQVICFSLDIILNFNTAYYSNGNIVYNRRRIRSHYFKGWFCFDVVSTLPYGWMNELEEDFSKRNKGIRFLSVIRVIRVFKLQRILKKFRDYIDYRPILQGIVSVIKLCLIISFAAHWCACGWNFIATEIEDADWTKLDAPDKYDVQDRYIAALYFSVTTMMTVGYGDITPTTSKERVYVIFIMLIGGGLFGYIMNSIAIILQSMETERTKNRKKIFTVTKYMEKKGLDEEVQLEVRKYLEFLFEDESTMKSVEKDMLNMLSSELKNKVYEQINGRLLYKNQVLTKSFSKKILYHVSSKIESRVYALNEDVFGSKEAESAIYFVVKGTLNLYLPRNQKPWIRLNREKCFGEVSFFTDMPCIYQAKSVGFSHLLVLKRTKFIESLEDFPLDRETFCMIKDLILIYEDYSALNLVCAVCDGNNHTAENCPKVQYSPSTEHVLMNYLSQLEQERHNFKRRPKRSSNALLITRELDIHAKKVTNNYPTRVLEIKTKEYEEEEDSIEHEDLGLLDRFSPRRMTGSRRKLSVLTKESKTVMKSIAKLMRSVPSQEKLKKGSRLHKIALNFRDMATIRTIAKSITDFNERPRTAQGSMLWNDISPEDLDLEPFNEFDRIKNFSIYFPHNNLNKLLEKRNFGKRRTTYMTEDTQKLKNHLKNFFKAVKKENK